MTGFWMCVGMQLWKGSEYSRIPSISYFIVQNSPPPAPFLKGGSEKKLKRGWNYGARAGLLKMGDCRFSYLIFSRFIIFTFRNYFTLCKILLCISRNIISFCHHNLMKKGHSKLSKNKPENIPQIKITYL